MSNPTGINQYSNGRGTGKAAKRKAQKFEKARQKSLTPKTRARLAWLNKPKATRGPRPS